jgi:hypothetical protein
VQPVVDPQSETAEQQRWELKAVRIATIIRNVDHMRTIILKNELKEEFCDIERKIPIAKELKPCENPKSQLRTGDATVD